ncbi:MAG TPA: aldehyde ferredoxin oxidoreductase family protein [Anaerolineaceae bacterium]|nr:aldehyde ferredoxin oxidoreductase family protein [Anaerolineaceae bacterium]
MAYGTPGSVLHVDLTASTVRAERFPEDLYRLYPGGKALAEYLLLREFPAHAGPLDPGNVLIFSSGLLCGAPISTAARFTAVARSPLTGLYGESEAGGFWGPELKFAGFEAIVIRGRAPRPVYLWISDGAVEIRDANHLWGKEPAEVQAAIRAAHGDKLIRVLQIGMAGENLVRYAAITNELRHYNGRTGMGAVMGSKNLKAIAVRGRRRYADFAFDPPALQALGRKLAQDVKNNPISWGMHEQGTLGLVDGLSAAGMLPTRNFRQGVFEGKNAINWESYAREIYSGRRSCFACSVQCKREVEADDRYVVSVEYGGPEYETVAGFGSNCGVADIQAIARANELCDRYTLDTITTSATIAFAMECYERGLIGPQDTGGIELSFGNIPAMLQMVDLIAHREGFGDLLSYGSRHAAKVIGQGSMAYTIQVKGEELAMHDPRGKVGIGLGYAVCETGADHLVSIHDPSLANPESFTLKAAQAISDRIVALPTLDLSDQKAVNYQILESWTSLGKTIGMCFFGPAPRSYLLPADLVAAVQAATGWDVTIPDLLKIGERAINLARIFNLREGLTPADDALPPRLFEPLENGPLAGRCISREDFARAMRTLYALKGWDLETGIPTPAKLAELDIDWAAKLLEEN